MMHTRPLVVLCIAWITGSASAVLMKGSSFWFVWCGIMVLTVLGCILLRQFIRIRSQRSPMQSSVIAIRAIGITLLIFLVASAYWHWNDVRNISQLPMQLKQPIADMVEQQVDVTGVITGSIDIDGDRVRFPLRLHAIQSSYSKSGQGSSTDSSVRPTSSIVLRKQETIMIQLKLAAEKELERAASWKQGDQISVTGNWQEPGVARNFGTFDYQEYLRTQYIHWILKVEGADALRPAELDLSIWTKMKLTMLGWNDHFRKQLGGQIERIFWQADQGYMKGLLIGNADDIDPESFAAFSRLGLTHILAISGLHIAIYVGLLLWLLRRIGLTKEAACMIVMILLPFYVLLTGASPSAIRAGLMGMIGLYLASRGKLKDGLHILCLVGWVMLIYEPYYLLNVSFQLSFAVTAGLLIYVPLLHALLKRLPQRIASAVAVTLVAQFISFPLTIYYFNQFSLLSFLANFILVPISGLLVLPIGSLALVLSYVWLPVGLTLGGCVSWRNDWCFRLVDWLDAMPGMLTIWASPGLWLILGYYGLLYIAFRCMRDLQHWLYQHGDDPQYARQAKSVAQHPYIKETDLDRTRDKRSDRTEYESANNTDIDENPTSFNPNRDSIPFWKLYRQRGLHWHIPWTKHRLIAVPVMGLALLLLLGYWYNAPHHGQDGLIQFLDIGQGDSILITTPAGKHILVDGGGTVNFRPSGQEWRQRKQPYEVGNKLLVPLLKQRGVHQLDAVIATHWDQDHVGGLEAVIEGIPVRQFLFNGTMPDNHQRDDMIRRLLDKQIPMYVPVAGMTMQPDPYTRLEFLAPARSSSQPDEIVQSLAQEPPRSKASTASVLQSGIAQSNVLQSHVSGQNQIVPNASLPLPVREDQNVHSIVFMLTLYDRHILFTGDADTTEEKSILNELQDQQTKLVDWNGQSHQAMKMDVLKVGHHGSKTSTSAEWLAYWQPGLSVISAGVNNRYGHPKPEVLDRLEEVHSAIARTDQQGEIQLRIDHRGHMSIRSMLE